MARAKEAVVDRPDTEEDLGEFLHLDPRDLVVGPNVRLDPKLDKDFVESIRLHGVKVPLVAYRDGGKVVVRTGQKRTLAAVEVERPTVPVWVRATAEEAEDVARIVEQLAENDHRSGITAHDRIKAYEQLDLLGLTPREIAHMTKRPKDEVEAGIKAAKSKLGAKAAERYSDFMDVTQLAALAELGEGDEATDDDTKALVVAAKSGQFDHVAQRIRDERTRARVLAAATARYEAAGLRVVPRPTYDNKEVARLYNLGDGKGGPLKVEVHESCPGHAAFLEETHYYPGDDGYADACADNGLPVPEPTEGEGAAEDGEESDDDLVSGWSPTYVCTNYPKYQHPDRHSRDGKPAAKAKAADLPPEQRAEEARGRKEVIQGNRDWKSATTVRRDFLKTRVAHLKKPPAGTVEFMAQCFAACDFQLRGALQGTHSFALELLGVVPSGSYGTDRVRALQEYIVAAPEPRKQVVALLLYLCAYENEITESAWRSSQEHWTRYLRFLASCGYEMSNVELRACGVDAPLLPDEPATAVDLPGAVAEPPAEGPTFVWVRKGGKRVEYQRAELQPDKNDARPHVVKVIYVDSRTAAWIDKQRIASPDVAASLDAALAEMPADVSPSPSPDSDPESDAEQSSAADDFEPESAPEGAGEPDEFDAADELDVEDPPEGIEPGGVCGDADPMNGQRVCVVEDPSGVHHFAHKDGKGNSWPNDRHQS